MATTAKDQKEFFLTVAEVGTVLRVKPETVRAWLGRRKLAAHKFGRSWRIAVSEIERFLDENLIPRKD